MMDVYNSVWVIILPFSLPNLSVCLSFFVCFCFLQQWYTGSTKAVCVWLTDRLDLQLHMYQLKTLIKIVKVIKNI